MLTAAEAEAMFASTRRLVDQYVVVDRPISISGPGTVCNCLFVSTPDYADDVWHLVQEVHRQRRWEDMVWEEFEAFMTRWKDIGYKPLPAPADVSGR